MEDPLFFDEKNRSNHTSTMFFFFPSRSRISMGADSDFGSQQWESGRRDQIEV